MIRTATTSTPHRLCNCAVAHFVRHSCISARPRHYASVQPGKAKICSWCDHRLGQRLCFSPRGGTRAARATSSRSPLPPSISSHILVPTIACLRTTSSFLVQPDPIRSYACISEVQARAINVVLRRREYRVEPITARTSATKLKRASDEPARRLQRWNAGLALELLLTQVVAAWPTKRVRGTVRHR